MHHTLTLFFLNDIQRLLFTADIKLFALFYCYKVFGVGGGGVGVGVGVGVCGCVCVCAQQEMGGAGGGTRRWKRRTARPLDQTRCGRIQDAPTEA